MEGTTKKPAAKKQAVQKPDAAKPVAADKKKKTTQKKKKVTLQQKILGLIRPRPRNFGIGQDVPFKRDMTHFVKWPQYVRLQRQRRVLLARLKTPPPINLFRHSLDKATAIALLKFLHQMRPEEKKAAKKRRLDAAAFIAKALKPKEKDGKPGKEKTPEQRAAVVKECMKTLAAKRIPAVTYGLNHVTTLVERKKAQLVVIAHDVDPIELVVWLPALCRKKKVPFCVIKSKARLGQIVHKKTCSVLAVTTVKKELRDEFARLVDAIKPQFLENQSLLRTWGEGRLGIKHCQAVAKEQRRIAKLETTKAQA